MQKIEVVKRLVLSACGALFACALWADGAVTKPAASAKENWYESEKTYTPGESVYATDFKEDWDNPYSSYLEFQVNGPGFFTFSMSYFGAEYWLFREVSVDGDEVSEDDEWVWDLSEEPNWQKKNLTLSGAGNHTVRIELSDLYLDNDSVTNWAEVTGVAFEAYAKQDTLGKWTAKARDYSCWIKDNLPTLQTQLAKDKTPKGRLLHALATLLTAGENASVQNLLKEFGLSIDYMNMEVTGDTSFASAPTGNKVIDTLVRVGEPLIKTAITDLEAIPADFTPFELTRDDVAYVDEDVTIDAADVTYLRTALKSLLCLGNWSKAYNAAVDYDQAAKDFYGLALKTSASEATLCTEAGWDTIDWLNQDDADTLKIKVVKAGRSVYVYVPRSTNDVDRLFVDLRCVDATDGDEATDGYAYFSHGEIYGDDVDIAAALNGATVFKAEIEDDDKDIDNVRLWNVHVYSYANDFYHKVAEHGECHWHYKSEGHMRERMILHQTKVMDKVRDTKALATAKSYAKEAISLWLKADSLVTSREDDALHLIEYGDDIDVESRLESLRENLTKALQSLNGGAVQDYDWLGLLPERTAEKYEGTLADPLAVNVNKLFSGDLTRAVLPPSVSTDYYVPDMNQLDPTLNGLLPETQRSELADLLDAMDIDRSELVPVTYVVTFNANGGTVDEETRDVAEGETLGALPDAQKRNAEFLGWFTAKTGGEEVLEETAIRSDVTYYAHWHDLKTVNLTVSGGTATDPNDEEGEAVTKLAILSGNSAELSFDETKILDKTGEEVGAFQRWVVSPADVDLGESFNPFDPLTEIVMPDKDVKITAQYVASVGAWLNYEFRFETGDVAIAPESFYWSPDKGKTLLPEGMDYPLAAGSVTITFYVKDDDGNDSTTWKAPASVKITIPKRGEEETFLEESAWFVAADGARQITFNANGGKCAVASAWYLDGANGGTYYMLPEPEVRKGYVFDGWDIAAKPAANDDSGLVEVDDPVDFSALNAKKPTLYARWLKTYTLSLKGTDVTAIYDDETYEKSVSVLQGEEVVINAPESYEAKGVTYLFQCWTPSKSFDFGDDYAASYSETSLVMPASDVTFTATYVKETEAAWMSLYATAEAVETDDFTIEADLGKFVWSVDGKVWYAHGESALLKKGSYTVQWKSLDDCWAAPTTKTKITLAAGDEYTNEETPAEFTFVYVASLKTLVYEDGQWTESTAGGTATMNPADGRLVNGKALTLTAKAAKNYAFVGWAYESEPNAPFCTSAKSTYALTADCCSAGYYQQRYLDETDHKLHLVAVFRPVSDYQESELYNLFEFIEGTTQIELSYQDALNGSAQLEAVAGCEASFWIGCYPNVSPLTFKTTGTLPKGMKFDATEMEICGTPTAVGTSTFTITATDPAGHACSLTLTVVVRALSADIAGNFRALLSGDGIDAGLLELSITSAGKASAKITTSSGTTSLTPTLEWYVDETEEGSVDCYSLYYWKSTGNDSSGSYVSLSVDLTDGYVSYWSRTWKNGVETASASLYGTALAVDTALLADEAFQDAFFNTYYTVSLTPNGMPEVEDVAVRELYELAAPGYLTMTVDKKGNVKVAGKLADGEKISASTLLLPEETEEGLSARVLLFIVPSSYKKKGYAMFDLTLSADGTVTQNDGIWLTPPLLDAVTDEENELFLQGLCRLSANGGVYSALSDLTSYYLSLQVETSTEPTYEYSYTGAEKLKVYDTVCPALESFGLDTETLTGGKNGKITVGKSAAPWKDSDGVYHYDETKAGATITNPSGLTLAFKPATGIFSGKFNLFFDYDIPQYDKSGNETGSKPNHKAVSCAYEGVVVDHGESLVGAASAVYSGKYTFEYMATDKKGNQKAATKTYTRKFALPVEWTLEEGR